MGESARKIYHLKEDVAEAADKAEKGEVAAEPETYADVLKRQIDPRLDRLFNKNVRCPYCKAKILKYTTTCARCGIHKQQLIDASNKSAKEMKKQKSGGKIFMTRNRPDDISFTKMALLLLVGLFGAHNFYVGRKMRGFLMLAFLAIGMIFVFIFPISAQAADGTMGMHPTRKSFEQAMGGMPFPTDFLIAAAVIMWAFDAIAIIFGFYKYPIRLGEKEVKPIDKEKK